MKTEPIDDYFGFHQVPTNSGSRLINYQYILPKTDAFSIVALQPMSKLEQDRANAAKAERRKILNRESSQR